jgi:hypothetical protein
MSKETLYDLCDRIVSAIDSGSWKHSWHLPKDDSGFIDWWSEKTAVKVKEILEDKLRSHATMAGRMAKLLEEVDWRVSEEEEE